MKRLDMPVEFVGGLRVSDADTVEIAKMVLVGKVNKDIVLRLNRHGQPAVGLCGDDGLLFRVATMEGPGGEDIGYVGRIERVDVGVIEPHRRGLHPGHRLGRRRPRRAARTTSTPTRPPAPSRARSAPTRSIFLTDVAGWLRDPADPDSVISETDRRRGRGRAADDRRAACGRSSQACLDAIHGGVSFAHIIDGRVPHSLLLELFTDAGIGTKVRPAR